MNKKELKILRKSRFNYKNSKMVKIYYILFMLSFIVLPLISFAFLKINLIISIIFLVFWIVLISVFCFLINISLCGYKLKYYFLGKKFKNNIVPYVSVDTQKDHYRRFGANAYDKRFYILEYVYNIVEGREGNYVEGYENIMDFILTGCKSGIVGYFSFYNDKVKEKLEILKILIPSHIMSEIELAYGAYLKNGNNISYEKFNDIIFSEANIVVYEDVILKFAEKDYDENFSDLIIFY